MKQEGFSRLIFGDSADMVFGGLDGLISKDYTYGEYLERFSYVMPYKALKTFNIITEPFERWMDVNGYVDSHGFINDVFATESYNSYCNACEAAGVESVDAFVSLEHSPVPILEYGGIVITK